ncbi:MAG: sulfur carrier protein ThiS [Ktedonobacteraceae bacterium]
MNEMFSKFTPTITIIANGQPRAVQDGSTIADLLREVAITPTHVVVQMNGVIIARSEFAQVALHEGNTLEIVTLVGGG